MIKIGNTIIIYNDSDIDFIQENSADYCLITCGLSHCSTITASSINDDGFTLCIQRYISTINNNIVSPQEFNIRWHKKPNEITPFLALVTLLLICEVPKETLKELMF